jgi:hypothetical protein
MTEAQWLVSKKPDTMLRAYEKEISAHPHSRKQRLFAIACCNRIWHSLTDTSSRMAVETSALFADGLVEKDQLMAAHFASESAVSDESEPSAPGYAASAATAVSATFFRAESVCLFASLAAGDDLKGGPEHTAQCNLIRDIFGNPFRPISFNAAWLTSTVLALANGMYNEKAFDRMPILADALQDAGCDNEDILNHCRQPGEHVRGCWVVDLFLNKK